MIEIKENFLSEDNYRKILSVVNSDNFPWFWNDNSSYIDRKLTELELKLYNINQSDDYPQLVHILFQNKLVNSISFDIFSELLLNKILNNGDLLYRVKLNLNFPINGYNIGKAHIDTSLPECNKTSIYYLNDSDGDTIFYNETNDTNFKSLSIKQKFTPKANTLVTFNTNNIHAASLPTTCKKRMVLNIVYGKPIL